MHKSLAVGHFFNGSFKEACARNLPRIREIFFAWPGVLSCRPAPTFTSEVRARMIDDLKWARANGLGLDALYNCNCYGEQAISRELADFVGRTMREMDDAGLLPDTVTTTSPFIATILRRDFSQVKIRWSVNLRVHGTVGFESVEELFDSFYVSREYQRDLLYLQEVAKWAKAHGKTMGMQANSGCLRQCAFQTFHDNLHGHGRIAQSQAGEEFGFSVFRCKTNYERGNYEDFLRSTWIRPEDLPHYEAYADIVKLATRRHPNPEKVLDAYASYSYDGDLAQLMDPTHSFPKSFDNKRFGHSQLWPLVLRCRDANNCRHCGRCSAMMAEVFR